MDLGETGFKGAEWNKLSQKSPMAGFCEHGNELFGSIRVGNFLNSSIIIMFSKEEDPAPAELLMF
jgi:hypothetical protein